MNKNIKPGDRVSGEFEPISIHESVVKVYGIYDGMGIRGIAKIITEDGLIGVVPSSLRKLVKKKKPETFTTSKGFVFTKTPLGWIDETSKLEWLNEFKNNLNHYGAEEWAEVQKKRLPTREEFEEAEKHGIRELPGMTWMGYCFWSASVSPDAVFYAYHLSGSYGYIDGDHRDVSLSYVAARAVRKV